MNAVMRISLLGSRTENLIKCACRWEGRNEILLLIISVYLINIHHTAETGYRLRPRLITIRLFVKAGGKLKSLQLELLCSTHQPHAVRRGRACSRWFRSPASANWPHKGNKKKSARFRRGVPNVPTALIGRLNDDDKSAWDPTRGSRAGSDQWKAQHEGAGGKRFFPRVFPPCSTAHFFLSCFL